MDDASFFVYYLAYDLTTDRLYGWTSYNQLIQLDYQTGEIETLGIFPSGGRVVGMTFDEQGNFYVMMRDEESEIVDLYKIVDVQDVVLEFIGSTNTAVENTYSSFFYDWYTDKFYWTVNQTSSRSLSEVDVNTAKVTPVIDFPNFEQLNGLAVIEKSVNSAPADVEHISFSSVGSALSGQLTILMPAVTQDNSPLSGNVNAMIYVGNELLENVSLLAGEIYRKSVTFDESGLKILRVIVSNEEGTSKSSIYTFWVGEDVPPMVSNLNAEYDISGDVVVSWDAVEIGAHGGYVDPSSVFYKITRLPDNVVLSNSLSEPIYIDESLKDIKTPFQSYKYVVTPYTSLYTGEYNTSNLILAGEPLSIPFAKDFNEDGDISLWTILDVNQDGKTWVYRSVGGFMETPSTLDNTSDDWLFTPYINLEGGGTYRLRVTLKSSYYAIPNFKITYGPIANPQSQKELLSFTTEIYKTGDEAEEILVEIPADQGGGYYFGFHMGAEKGSNAGIFIHNVSVALAAAAASPGKVTDLSIQYGEEGKAPASLSFTAPVLTTAGNNLTSINYISIYRNDSEEPVHKLESVTPGQALQWIDNGVAEGINYYRIVAANIMGEGLSVQDSVYIGADPLVAVTDLKLERNNMDNAVLSWTAPTKGIHNGYTKECVYQIKRNGVEIVAAHSGTTYTDTGVTKTDQELCIYTVTPFYADVADSYGWSAESNKVRFGFPYATPFYESFKNSSYEKSGWDTKIISGKTMEWGVSNRLNYTDFSPQDSDRGMAVCAIDGERGQGVLISPIIDISSLETPQLRFWLTHYAYTSDNVYLTVTVSTDEGATFEPLYGPININTLENDGYIFDGWNLYDISLADYKDAGEIMIGFDVEVYGFLGLGIDNLSIAEKPDKDIKVLSFDSPQRLFAGSSNEFDLILQNSGKQVASDYTINLYKNGEQIASKKGEPIAVDEIASVTISASFPLSDVGKAYLFYAEADFPGDELEADNVSQYVASYIDRSVYSSVTLAGVEEEGNIYLEWSAPVDPKAPVLVEESFEDYPAFTITELGEWTLYDGDGLNTRVMGSSIFNLWDYENVGKPMAYQVFKARDVAPAFTSWNARTGEQLLASFASVRNDDWLISPELNGSSQEIVFYARSANEGETTNPERFIFHSSMGGTEIKDFRPLSEGAYIEVPTRWTEYRYTVPEGTRHFAIQCVSELAITFLVDDISFVKAGEPLTLLGYNVYCNEVKLNSALLSPETLEYTYEVTNEDGKVFAVTAEYAQGESNYSNTVSFGNVSIGNTIFDSIFVYNPAAGEILVEGGENLLIEVIGIDGSLVYRGIGMGSDKISLMAGGYLVKVGQKVMKVMVK